MERKELIQLFKNQNTGRIQFKGLKHKEDGTDLSDLEYFELLGRKAIKMDEENNNPRVPTNYGKLDRNVVEVAKNICKGIDEGMSVNDLNDYLHACIQLEND